MLRRTVRRLAATLSLAAGATALLFLIFDSGVLGDPARRVAGPRADARRLGEVRLALGHFRRFEPDALHVRLDATTRQGGEVALELRPADAGVLRLRLLPAGPERRVPAAGRGLAAVAADLAAAARDLGAGGEFRVAAGLAAADGAGLVTALAGAPLRLPRGGEGVGCPWAEAVPTGARLLGWFRDLLRLDLGRSLATGRPLAAEIGSRAGRSLLLTAPALLLATLLALGLALIALRRPRAGRILGLLSLAGLSLSSLVWVLGLRELLVRRLGLFPAQGWAEPLVSHMALPILLWTLVALWPEYRFQRAVLVAGAADPALTAARARGLPARRILLHHLLRPALVPVVTRLCLALPFLFLGSLVLEQVFAIPGLGSFTFEAVQANDPLALRAATWVVALTWLASQWLADLLCALLDPRWRRP